ncbi:hypothetical protein M2459_002037 [Parabacteroides sp. PF5-5]|uniref:hypothetical protein n=1 Tax=unclassified Parabacteroides TaxID=2649774 RepID=UPI0024732D0D|nr:MULTISPECIES: hypothetical protein [unclassified Parabacteroides]MDH6305568.1 hypothetical protein [Parabacteroides sp. PH5-39]MDH6316392.1 hypothetical protein [Parabacteroides sp. PF5-13]MDH6319877.1 hypothetical protein [Parabacteroides sp. PH5-13]MDH6323532.1 hypothetical protein [Parabacteroides sp. PH5-8]MDH6327579.1 hypothetical protein [Parabacteroides sp. PH5-41]
MNLRDQKLSYAAADRSIKSSKKGKTISENDMKNGISVEEVKKQVHKHIDELFAE